jgi:hypothetical protein
MPTPSRQARVSLRCKTPPSPTGSSELAWTRLQRTNGSGSHIAYSAKPPSAAAQPMRMALRCAAVNGTGPVLRPDGIAPPLTGPVDTLALANGASRSRRAVDLQEARAGAPAGGATDSAGRGGRGGPGGAADSTGRGGAGAFGGGRGGADGTFPALPGRYIARLSVTPAEGAPTTLDQPFALTKDPMVILSDNDLKQLYAFRLGVVKLQQRTPWRDRRSPTRPSGRLPQQSAPPTRRDHEGVARASRRSRRSRRSSPTSRERWARRRAAGAAQVEAGRRWRWCALAAGGRRRRGRGNAAAVAVLAAAAAAAAAAPPRKLVRRLRRRAGAACGRRTRSRGERSGSKPDRAGGRGKHSGAARHDGTARPDVQSQPEQKRLLLTLPPICRSRRSREEGPRRISRPRCSRRSRTPAAT